MPAESILKKQIKTMIEYQKKSSSWEFLFVAANIDAIETASQYGISADRANTWQISKEL